MQCVKTLIRCAEPNEIVGSVNDQEVDREDEHLRTLEYTYEASFLSTWLMTTWTTLFLPLYSLCCLVSRQLKPTELAIDIKDSALAFRDKGFTIGNVALFLLRNENFTHLGGVRNWWKLQTDWIFHTHWLNCLALEMETWFNFMGNLSVEPINLK